MSLIESGLTLATEHGVACATWNEIALSAVSQKKRWEVLILKAIARELSKYYAVELTNIAGVPVVVASIKHHPSIKVRLVAKGDALAFLPPWPSTWPGQLRSTPKISMADPTSLAAVVQAVHGALWVQLEHGTRVWRRYCSD